PSRARNNENLTLDEPALMTAIASDMLASARRTGHLAHRPSPGWRAEGSIPDLHGGSSPVVAEDVHGARIEQKVLAGLGGQADPARPAHAPHVSAREQRDVTL